LSFLLSEKILVTAFFFSQSFGVFEAGGLSLESSCFGLGFSLLLKKLSKSLVWISWSCKQFESFDESLGLAGSDGNKLVDGAGAPRCEGTSV